MTLIEGGQLGGHGWVPAQSGRLLAVGQLLHHLVQLPELAAGVEDIILHPEEDILAEAILAVPLCLLQPGGVAFQINADKAVVLGEVLLHPGQTQRIIADVVLVVIPLGGFQRGSEISSQGIVQPGLCLFGSLCGGTGRAPARHQALFAFLCQRLQQRVLCKECLCRFPALCGGLHRFTLLCLTGCDLLFADADIAAHLLHGLAGSLPCSFPGFFLAVMSCCSMGFSRQSASFCSCAV